MNELILNKKRIYYLDFMRGLAVFFMVMQHTMLVHEFTGGEGRGIIASIFVLLGTAPAAPVFMFIMGIFIMKSKSDSKSMCKRGLKLVLLGYGLNLARFTIPMLIAGESSSAIEMLFSVDILQLAGLSYILAAGIKKFAENKYVIPIMVLVVLIVSPYLWGISSSNPITDLLWGTSGNVAFPFFPWCIYPMLGMYLSRYLTKNKLDKKVKRNLLILGSLMGVIGLLSVNIFPHTDYSRYGLGASLMVISFVFIWICISEHIANKYGALGNSKLGKLLSFWSIKVTNIYIVQWIIFGWSMLLLGANEFHGLVAMIIGLLVMLSTHILIKYTRIDKWLSKI